MNLYGDSITPTPHGNSTGNDRSLDGLAPIGESFEMEAFLSNWQANELQRQEEKERREIALIQHDGGESFERWMQELDAKSDPATNDAFNAILAGCPDSPKGSLKEKAGHAEGFRYETLRTDEIEAVSYLDQERSNCTVPMVRKNNGVFETVWFPCKSRKCSNCTGHWRAERLNDLGAVVDRLSGSDMDAPTIGLSVGIIPEDEWQATSRRVRRHGSGWFTVPLSGNERLVLTNDVDFGSPRPAENAIEIAAEALVDLSERPGEARQVRFSKSWRDLADIGKPEKFKDDAIEWLGIATKASTPGDVVKAAERAGGVAAPVASLDEDLGEQGDSLTMRVKVPEQTEWKFLELIGFKSFAQVAEERAERKAMLAYDIRESESQRRRQQRRVLVAA